VFDSLSIVIGHILLTFILQALKAAHIMPLGVQEAIAFRYLFVLHTVNPTLADNNTYNSK